MTLGELSREELSAGCSGRAEKPTKARRSAHWTVGQRFISPNSGRG